MNNSPRSGDTSGLHTGGTFGMLSQDNLQCILSYIPVDERLFAAMVSTELYHTMKIVVAKSPDIRNLDPNRSGKLFFTPKRLMFTTPKRIQLLHDMTTAAFKQYILSGVWHVDNTLLEWSNHDCAAMEMLVQYCPVLESDPLPYLEDNLEKYSIKTTIFDTNKIITAAVKGGNVNLVHSMRWTLSLSVDISHAIMAIQFIRDNEGATRMLDVILEANGCYEGWGYELLETAVRHCRPHIITYLLTVHSKEIKKCSRRGTPIMPVLMAAFNPLINQARSHECLRVLFSRRACKYIYDELDESLNSFDSLNLLNAAANCERHGRPQQSSGRSQLQGA
jgi:hypothetical protein